MSIAVATSYSLLSEGCLRLGGTIPLLENDNAGPLEFICSPAHLLGRHSPAVARFR